MKVVIVGGVAGGASAAARLRRLDEQAEIIVFERGPYVSFANCGLPYYVGGEIPSREKLVVQTPESLRARFNVDVRTESEVLAVDRNRKMVRVLNRRTREEYEENYSTLILATGAAPVRPPIPGIERPGLFTLRDIPDVDAIMCWLTENDVRRGVIVGGGYIGLEMLEQLHRRKVELVLIEALPQVMAPLDPEMAALIHREIRRQGITLHLGDPVVAFESPREGEHALASVVVTKNGRREAADIILFGVGVRPETELARRTGLEIGKRNGIVVNDFLQTSDPDIYAIGDCIEVTNVVTGAKEVIPLAGPANRQGRLVGDNIVLPEKRRYRGTLGTGILRLFTLTAACSGANERQLHQAGIAFETVVLHPGSHAGYYPGSQRMTVKLLFAPKDGRILGAQIVGGEGVDKRIDVLATAILGEMTVDDLIDLELAYAPPFGSAKDPINLAGMAAQNVRRGLVTLRHVGELHDPTSNLLLLDVRSPHEVKNGALPGALHIPLDSLRNRLAEIPRDRLIVPYCQSGQRSYLACRILSQNGFRCENLSGGYELSVAKSSLSYLA